MFLGLYFAIIRRFIGLLWAAYIAVVRGLNRRVDKAFEQQMHWTDPDLMLIRVRKTRTTLGLLVITWATCRYAPLGTGAFVLNLVYSGVRSPFTKATIAFGVFLAASVLIYVTTDSSERSGIARRLARPLWTAGLIGIVVSAAFLIPLRLMIPLLPGDTGGDAPPLAVWLLVVCLIAVLIGLPVLYKIALLGVRTSFSANEGHPLLPAFVGIGVSLYGLFGAVYTELHGGGHPYFPPLLRITLGFGGAIVNLALALWEIRRLYDRGVSLRSPSGV